MPSELRVFQQEQEPRADGCSGNGRRDDGPAQRGGDVVWETAAQSEVDGGGDEVGESLKIEVGMNSVGANVGVEREECSGIRGEDDEEL